MLQCFFFFFFVRPQSYGMALHERPRVRAIRDWLVPAYGQVWPGLHGIQKSLGHHSPHGHLQFLHGWTVALYVFRGQSRCQIFFCQFVKLDFFFVNMYLYTMNERMNE